MWIIYLFLINAAGLLLMLTDKKRAIQKRWRISEATLMTVAILGGSLGSFLGMRLFRHKTRHPKFSVGLPVILLLQLALLSFFLYKKYAA